MHAPNHLWNVRGAFPPETYVPDSVLSPKSDHSWLKEEIAYTKKAAKLHLPQPAESTLPEKEPAEKIEANMSVAELAYLFKALSDSGLIKIPNYTDFFHSIATNYRTRQFPNLSADSFRNKFYSTEPGIRNTVKQHIIALMNQINLNS